MAHHNVYIVTHGKRNDGPDPGMTLEGFSDVAALRHLLPHNPSVVVCGTGRRQRQVAQALGLIPSCYSTVVGGPEGLDAQLHDGVQMIVLADGEMIPYSMDTTETDLKPSMTGLVLGLSNNAVICSGRVSLLALGLTLEQAKSGAVYVIMHDDGRILGIDRCGIDVISR